MNVKSTSNVLDGERKRMRALILNSGKGTRMGELTSTHPKCMTLVDAVETILSRQLKIALRNGVSDFVITTGYFDEVLTDYVRALKLPINVIYVKNPLYDSTNYIYSMYCARDYLDAESIILMHGDLVFENKVFSDIIQQQESAGVVSSIIPLPEKDFKARVIDGRITQIGINVFENALSFQPLYRFSSDDWKQWMGKINEYVENNSVTCYAENALNDILDRIYLKPMDVRDRLCEEVDNVEDLKMVMERIERLEK